MKLRAYSGFMAASTAGFCSTWYRPNKATTMNHSAVMGPKNLPMPLVPCFCTMNSSVSTTSVMGTT